MQKLVVFDVDGVLLDVVEGGFILLANAIGREAEVSQFHEEYERRKSQGPWGLEQLAMLFKGQTLAALRTASEKICAENLMFGAKEVIDELKKRDCKIAFYSSNPIVVLEALQKVLYADFICGNVLEFNDGICTGLLAEKVDRYEKAKRLAGLVSRLGLSKESVYIGVSIYNRRQHY